MGLKAYSDFVQREPARALWAATVKFSLATPESSRPRDSAAPSSARPTPAPAHSFATYMRRIQAT